MAEQYSTVYMYHHFFIQSSVHGHLGCFHVLAIVNSAAVNNGINVIFFNFGFLGVYAKEWDAGSYDGFILRFLSNLHTVSYSGCIKLHSHQYFRRVLFSPHILEHLLSVEFFIFTFFIEG